MEIFRNMRRRKMRSSLTILGIVIGVLALTTMGALSEHLNSLVDGGVKYFGSSIQVTTPAGQSTPLLPMSAQKQIAARPGVVAVYPHYSFEAKPGTNGGASFGAPDTIIAADPGELSHGDLRLSVASGTFVASGSHGQVLLGSVIAKDLGAQVGSVVQLPQRPADAKPGFVSHPFTVAGILATTQTAPDNFGYITQPDGQMLLRDSLPPALQGSVDVTTVAQSFTAYTTPGASLAQLDTMAADISSHVPGVSATKPSVTVAQFQSFSATFTEITVGAAILALVIGGLSVINTMVMTVSERVREIGLRKAIGARTGHILREYLREALAIGVIGGIVGWLLGFGLTSLINSASGVSGGLFLVTPRLTAIAIGFAAGLATVAGVLPAIRAARMDPVRALRTTG
ncbi:MAG: ABC transporter permease [Candidatus Dormibacteraeota bacterium]|uniref:ABC transporter permease n=1 Tax=Candidatus Amunia macphersoniae TaxID=3127014 RepID=A0A934KIY1_9BACT|nr:ABC transporter permease [Candidatus Dormibacteraeota bacterium]